MRWNATAAAGLFAIAACGDGGEPPIRTGAHVDPPSDAFADYMTAQEAYINCAFTAALSLEPCGHPTEETVQAAMAACAGEGAEAEIELNSLLPTREASEESRRAFAEVVERLQANLNAAIGRLRGMSGSLP